MSYTCFPNSWAIKTAQGATSLAGWLVELMGNPTAVRQELHLPKTSRVVDCRKKQLDVLVLSNCNAKMGLLRPYTPYNKAIHVNMTELRYPRGILKKNLNLQTIPICALDRSHYQF